MNTNERVRAIAREEFDVRGIKDCHVADVRKQFGLSKTISHNRNDPNKVKYPCNIHNHPEKFRAIVHALCKLRQLERLPNGDLPSP